MRALLIGGTGPTGPHILNGLAERGYAVTMLNRGSHGAGVTLPDGARHLVGDPHFAETLRDALGSQTFDITIATYGRIRFVAEVMAGRTGQLITVGGSPGIRGSRQPSLLFPAGQQTPIPEDAERVPSIDEFKFGYLARISEDAVLDRHAAGVYSATHFRYPLIYGPRQLRPAEWPVIRRLLDGRRHIVLPDAGLTMLSRGFARNMAGAVLLAVDQPDNAAGQLYHAADTHQLSLAQWVQVIAAAVGSELEVISVPAALAYPARNLMISRRTSHHQLFDTFKLRAELGYADLVSPLDALAETARWYAEHPPEESDQEAALMRAHYDTEDAMARIVKEAEANLQSVPFEEPDYQHPYAHPKQPGQGSDHHGR
ncbi:MAG: epimerase [Pseudomonadota bacterium]